MDSSLLPTSSEPIAHIDPSCAHTHMHRHTYTCIFSPTPACTHRFFTHSSKRTHTLVCASSRFNNRTHIHSHDHVSAVSGAPESLHSLLSALQKVLYFVHQLPERREKAVAGPGWGNRRDINYPFIQTPPPSTFHRTLCVHQRRPWSFCGKWHWHCACIQRAMLIQTTMTQAQ